MQMVFRVKASTNRSSNDGIIETYRRWVGENSFTKIQEVRDANMAVATTGPNGWSRGYVMGCADASYARDTTWIIDEIEFSNSSLLDKISWLIAPHPLH